MGTTREIQSWRAGYEELAGRIRWVFSREEPWRNACDYLQGLLSQVPRKNAWQLAEQAGDANPYGLQHLLGKAKWDADDLCDEVRDYTLEHLGTENAALIVDETGFLKKGQCSAGVARQYSGTAGRVDNAQIGVFVAYATAAGHALIDRELYLPAEWTEDPARCRAAGIPPERAFAPKSELARQMLARAFEAGVRADWVLGDEVYGTSGHLRSWLEEQRQPYVLTISSSLRIWRGKESKLLPELARSLAPDSWVTLTVGDGAKGPRRFEWARFLAEPGPEGHEHWFLVRRSLDEHHEMAYYRVFGASSTSLEDMARAAGTRWAVEECFEQAKGEVGLDQYEVRSWCGWYRHITLSMLALTFLAGLRERAEATVREKRGPQSGKARDPMRKFKRARGLRYG